MASAYHGSTAVMKVQDSGGTLQDVSAYLTQAGLADAVDTAESSHLGDTAKEYVAGLEDHTFDLSGDLDATIDGYLNGIKRAVKNFEYYPIGNGLGAGNNIKYSGSCILTKLDRSSPVNGVVTFTASFQVTGPVTRAMV